MSQSTTYDITNSPMIPTAINNSVLNNSWHWIQLMKRFTGGTLRELKKSSKEICHMMAWCMWSWESSKFEPFSFSLISARNTDHVSNSRVSSLFLARKSWESSKFEEKLNSRQKWFEFWALSGSHASCHHVTNLLRWLFELSQGTPRIVNLKVSLRFETIFASMI